MDIRDMIPNCFYTPGKQRLEVIALARGLAVVFAERQKLSSSAIISLSKQRPLKRLSFILRIIAQELHEGRPAAEAFDGRDGIFGAFFCRTAAHGILSQKPGLFFSRLADHFEADEHFRKRTASILRYPFLFVSGAIGAMITFLAFIIPDAARTISVISGKLPPATHIALYVFSSLPLLLVTAVILSVCAWYSNRIFHWAEKCACGIPFIGDFYLKISLRRVALGISFLLSNGVGIPEAFEISAATVSNSPLRAKLLRAAQEMHGNGTPRLSALKDADGIFPPSVFDISSDAQDIQREGIPEGMPFRKIADFYENEIEAGLTASILIIEPAIVAIAGFLGGGILAALYLPLLQISSCR
jgi:type IV pilus assembly protein PilC